MPDKHYSSKEMMQKRARHEGKPLLEINTLGDRLRVWRRSLALTQSELGITLDVDIGTLRKYELGVNAPGAPFLTKLCARGLCINWLLMGEGNMLLQKGKTTLTGDSAAKLQDLSDNMSALYKVDPDKFHILARGFIARSKEAERLAVLELKEAAVSLLEKHGVIVQQDPTHEEVQIPVTGSTEPIDYSDIVIPGKKVN